ncbi:MAG TPA: NRDE family protein [Jatrophihabitans sp.]|nr:NRDE family protein [Jatrophihabitans sp.]
MCTVVWEWTGAAPLRILALRDEFAGRAFDDPAQWWRAQPSVVGGRDRLAGGTWCASDVRSGATALVVNRIERRDGTPSRGTLPLAALAHGRQWTEAVDVSTMAAFNLLLADAEGVSVWTWDGRELGHLAPSAGRHMLTSQGTDADDAKTRRFAAQFGGGEWTDVVTACEPSSADDALVVRRRFDDRSYETVFGQLIVARPGKLRIEYSRTPWRAGSWVLGEWM